MLDSLSQAEGIHNYNYNANGGLNISDDSAIHHSHYYSAATVPVRHVNNDGRLHVSSSRNIGDKYQGDKYQGDKDQNGQYQPY